MQNAITLMVTHEWWLTWWAFSLYGLLLITILHLLRRYELNRIRLKNQLKLEKTETDNLRSLDKAKSQFFANISHEFRTPLTMILGQVENVIASNIETIDREKLEVANRNAGKLLMLINQLLDLSKLEAGSMKLIVSEHNLVAFLKGLFFSFQSLAGMNKISLLFDSDRDNIPVFFDLDKMEKIFYNLVSNAIKYSDANGKVILSIKIIDALFVEIRVENNGCGIPPDQLPHIFDRFYQVDSSGPYKNEGTGIGLALAKELVELHQGSISAESIEEANTTFFVRLPMQGLKPEKGISETQIAYDNISSSYYTDTKIVTSEIDVAEPEDIQDGSREIVLIVEDNKDVRDFIRGHLETDFLVREAENGKTGLFMAQEAVPDLIITDLMMPVMDGHQFCREIRRDERTSHIPVIILTAKAGFEDKIEGLETGIDDYIIKPFSSKELKVRIRNLLDQRRLLRARYSLATIIKPSEITATSVDKLFLQKIIMAIEANFENRDFTIESLASEANMSVSQLNRKLNALIDQPAGQLMRSLRLQRAADLLENDAGTVAQVCYQLLFNDQAYFSRAFKKQFGRSPGEYRKG